MQTSKKRIMGAFGLASVAAMTIAAYNVPAPAAYANTSVPLTVTVQAQNVYTQITGSIHDGTQTAISPVDIQVIFSHASRLDYSVSISQGETTVEDIDTGSVDTSTIDGVTDQGDGYAGTYTASINLKQLLQNAGLNPNKKANFTFKVTGFSSTGGVSMGDAITFTYGQTAINPDDNINPDAEEGETNVPTAENGDPVISVETGDEVTRLHAIIVGPDGAVLFEQDVDVTSNLTNMTLAFAEHNAKSGWYTVTVQAYDAAGTLVGTSELRFYYAAPIGIPNTGGSIFSGLNISRADFLISGLLVFGIATVGGLLLMNRGKKSSKRARK